MKTLKLAAILFAIGCGSPVVSFEVFDAGKPVVDAGTCAENDAGSTKRDAGCEPCECDRDHDEGRTCHVRHHGKKCCHREDEE